MRDLPVRAARWSAAHPRTAIVGWLVFVVLCLGLGSAVGTNKASPEDFQVGEAGRAEVAAVEGGLERRQTEQVLISARAGKHPDRARTEGAARKVVARMDRLDEVRRVADPVRSADGRTLLVQVTLKGNEQEADIYAGAVLKQTAAVQKAYPDLRIEETGDGSIGRGVDGQRGSDLALAEMITLPVTLVTLLLVFGSLLMAGVPLLLALSSIAAAMGLSMLASHLVPDVGIGSNVILLIGMAVGVDYTLFYLKREREEKARSEGRLSPEALVELAADTSGRAVVVSGIAVAASGATMFLASDVIFSSIATGTIVVVMVAVASSLTVLPALLVVLGRRANRRAVKRAAKQQGSAAEHGEAGGSTTAPHVRPRRAARDARSGRMWTALLRPAVKHPAITLVVSVLAMLVLAAPALELKLAAMGTSTHSRSIPAMQTYDRLHKEFPELRSSHQVLVRASSDRADEVADALAELSRRAAGDPLFGGGPADGPAVKPRISPDRRITSFDVPVRHSSGSQQASDSLERLRKVHLPATVGKVPGAEAMVSGNIARDADYPVHQSEKLPLVVLALLVVTFGITVFAFRSVVLGIIGVLLNLLSAAAAFGVLTAVFQHTWAEGLLAFDSTGSIGARVPLFLFVILFGLSMDYQVFVVSRIREAALKGVPTRTAVIEGIAHSAGVVTSAAAVMFSVFASFVFLHLIEMKQIGFILAVGVLLDAFIIRILVLPSLMMLLGRANWWPSRTLRRAQSAPPKG